MGMISKIIQKERETNNKVAQTGRSKKTQKKEKQQSYSRTATVMFATFLFIPTLPFYERDQLSRWMKISHLFLMEGPSNKLLLSAKSESSHYHMHPDFEESGWCKLPWIKTEGKSLTFFSQEEWMLFTLWICKCTDLNCDTLINEALLLWNPPFRLYCSLSRVHASHCRSGWLLNLLCCKQTLFVLCSWTGKIFMLFAI